MMAILDERAWILSELRNFAGSGCWEEFVDFVLENPLALAPAFGIYYKQIPDELLRREIAICAYVDGGDEVPEVRQAVRALKTGLGKLDLPDSLRDADFITVYRAGEEEIEKSKYRLSWTIEKKTALFFLNEYWKRHAKHLYRAKIHPQDVIAYTNARKEHEIIQYKKIYDIEEITNDAWC